MADGDAPLVSVVTPVYNTADYLGECIESVLDQTLDDLEYVVVDNASTDGSSEIAREYAEKDPRIRFVRCEELLPQIPNYNRALRHANPGAKYCKIAQADDRLLPRCLEEMVELAETDPDIAVVGGYTILQDRVFLDGLDFYESVVDGTELCRRYFRDGPYVFGSPTTHLYRMEDVRDQEDFYREDTPFADADAVVRLLIGRKFGFVHQTLSFVRTSNDSISTRREKFDIDALTRRLLLEKYGRKVFDEEEFQRARRRLFWRHHRVLGRAALLRRPDEFWELHTREAAKAVDLDIRPWAVVAGGAVEAARWFANLEDTVRNVGSWIRRRSVDGPSDDEPPEAREP